MTGDELITDKCWILAVKRHQTSTRYKFHGSHRPTRQHARKMLEKNIIQNIARHSFKNDFFGEKKIFQENFVGLDACSG